MSAIGWIDFSSEHRERVQTVIDLLSAPGVIDELGIGAIRDTFADRMFPGISTIQTRAKYFTLTLLLFEDYQRNELQKRNPRTLGRYLEEEEKWCRIQLVLEHGEGRQNLGIIGGSFGLQENRDVVRRPSSIYWNGLRQFGCISPRHLSMEEFGRRMADDGHRLRAILHETKSERGDDQDAEDLSHAPRVFAPDVRDDYWENLTIDLTATEAVFLRHQITAHKPDSVIGQILLDDARMRQILKLRKSAGFEDFAALPLVDDLKNEELRLAVTHARDFWTIFEGAHIRYNCMLQQRFGTSERREAFEEEWEEWRARISSDFPASWDTMFMWRLVEIHGTRIKEATRRFIEGWIGECQRGAPDTARCDELVRKQELFNKRNRARLRAGNGEAINAWLGFRGLDYRLGVVRQLVRDIWEGGRLEGGADA